MGNILRVASWSACAALLTASARAQLTPIDGRAPIPPELQRIEALVDDGLARTRVRQVFVNPYDAPLEAVWSMRVPDEAALVDLVLEAGGERLEGELVERRLARRTYDEIVRGRRDPALVEKVGSGEFRVSVFPVLPGAETAVEVEWIEHAPLVGGALRYACPLAPSEPRAELVVATVRLRSSVPWKAVSASRADAQVARTGPGEALVSFESAGAERLGELVVTAEIASVGARLDLRTHRDASGESWFLALVTPPPAAAGELAPRDVLLAIDTSGSMAADGKLEAAQRSALWLLRRLRPEDRVQIVRFSSDVEPFAREPFAATPEKLARLEAFVAGFRAAGSTAFGDALRAVSSAPSTPGRARTIVLLTDGRPTLGETAPAALVALAAEAGRAGWRLYPFGVGDDVDAGLLRGLAAAGRGRAELFRPGAEIEPRLTAFLERTAAPVITDLELSTGDALVVDRFPRPLPDLHLGEQVAICGRFRGGAATRFTLTGRRGSESVSLSAPIPAAGDEEDSRSVPLHYARQKLAHLEDALRLRLGLADDAYYAALDRGAYSTADEIVQEAIEVSLAHRVQCAYTSFLALTAADRERLARAAAPELRAVVLDPAGIRDHEEEQGSKSLVDGTIEPRAFHDVIGLGGGVGGRFGGMGRAREAADAVVREALERLAAAQGDDGSWAQDPACTGLALVAFFAMGHTTRAGDYRERVTSGVKWLREQEDPRTGRIGVGASPRGQALATLALVQAYGTSKSPLIRGTAQRAAGFLARSVEQVDADELGWCLLALEGAARAGLALGDDPWPSLRRRLDELEREDELRPRAVLALGLLLAGAEEPASSTMRARCELLLLDVVEASARDLQGCFWGALAVRRLGVQAWARWGNSWSARREAVLDGPLPADPAPAVERAALRVLCVEAHRSGFPL